MGTFQRYFVAVCCCLAIAGGAWGQQRGVAPAPQGPPNRSEGLQPPEYHYRGLHGRLTPLRLSEEKYGVLFEQNVEADEQELILQSQADVVGRSSEGDQSRAVRFRMVDVVDSPRGADSVRDSVRTMKENEGVEHVAPVFVGEYGGEELLTQFLYFSMPAPVNEEKLQALLAEHGAELIKRIEYPELGKVGFRLRVTSSSPGDALETANALDSRQDVLEAAPVFSHLYPTLTDSPDDPRYDSTLDTTSGPTIAATTPQWNLHAITDWSDADQAFIDVENAWDALYVSPGGTVSAQESIIAILDTGVQLNYGSASGSHYIKHSSETSSGGSSVLAIFPDLAGNQWDKSGSDDYGDSVDDDGNGKIDDAYGWDFVGSDLSQIYNPAYAGDPIPFPDYLTLTDLDWDSSDIPDNAALDGIRTHGNGSATVAAAVGDNGIGLAGLCWGCKVMPLRIQLGGYAAFSGGGDFLYDWRVADAIRYAADNGAKVIGGSMSSQTYSPDVHDAVRYARAKGCVVVAPTGNADFDLDAFPTYPACLPEVIGVGGIRADRIRCQDGDFDSDWSGTPGGSSYGSAMDFVAPSKTRNYSPSGAGATGIGIPNGRFAHGKSADGTSDLPLYASGGGTSSAWPQVAGLIGFLMQYENSSAWWFSGNKVISPTEVQAVLAFTADDITASTDAEASAGRDAVTGWGLPSMSAALDLLTNSTKRTKLHSEGNVEVSWIDHEGNLFCQSRIVPSVGASSWMLSPAGGDYTLSNGGVKMRIDDDGFVYVAGTVTTNVSSLPSGTYIQVNGVNVASLTSGGNLHIKGITFEGMNPDPEYKDLRYELHVPFFKDVDATWMTTSNETTYIALNNRMPIDGTVKLRYFDREGNSIRDETDEDSDGDDEELEIAGSILGALTVASDSYDNAVSFRPFAADGGYKEDFKTLNEDARSLLVLSSTPISGRLLLGQHSDLDGFTFHTGVQLLDSDVFEFDGTMKSQYGATHLCVPFMADNAGDNTVPPTTGGQYAQFIAVQNLYGYPTHVEVKYFTASSSTPSNTWTLSLDAFETVRWRPWHTASGYEEYDVGNGIVHASSGVHSVEMRVIDDDDDERSPMGRILGYSLIYSADGIAMYELPEFDVTEVGGFVNFEPIYIPYVNDSGQGALPPGGGNKSVYIGLHNPTDYSVSLNIKYRNASGTQHTQNTESLTIPAHQSVSWHPYYYGLTPPSQPVITGSGQYEASVEITRTSANGNVVGRLFCADSTGIYAMPLVTGTGVQSFVAPFVVDNGTTNTYFHLRNTTASTVNYQVQYYDADGVLTSTDTDSVPARGYDRWRPNKSPASNARQAVVSVTSAGGRMAGSLITEDPTAPYAFVPVSPTIVFDSDFDDGSLGGWTAGSVFSAGSGILQRSPGTALSNSDTTYWLTPVADHRLRFSYMYVSQSSNTGSVDIRNSASAARVFLELTATGYSVKEFLPPSTTHTRGSVTAAASSNTWYDVYAEAIGGTVNVWRVEAGEQPNWGTPDLTVSTVTTTSSQSVRVNLHSNSDYRYDNLRMRTLN